MLTRCALGSPMEVLCMEMFLSCFHNGCHSMLNMNVNPLFAISKGSEEFPVTRDEVFTVTRTVFCSKIPLVIYFCTNWQSPIPLCDLVLKVKEHWMHSAEVTETLELGRAHCLTLAYRQGISHPLLGVSLRWDSLNEWLYGIKWLFFPSLRRR